MVKKPLANVGVRRDVGSIPGSGRAPGGGHGHPLQDSCLENPHGQRSLGNIAHGAAKSRMQLKRPGTPAHRLGVGALNTVCRRLWILNPCQNFFSSVREYTCSLPTFQHVSFLPPKPQK